MPLSLAYGVRRLSPPAPQVCGLPSDTGEGRPDGVDRGTDSDGGSVPGSGEMKAGRPLHWRVGAVAACLVAGLLIGVARASAGGQDVGTRSVDLSVVVRDAQQRVLEADSRAADLQAQLGRAAEGDVSPQVEQAMATVDALAPAAGLVPVVGDIVSGAMGAWVVWEARNLGMSRLALTGMAARVGFHTLLGAIPLVDDAADLLYRSNTRNLKRIRKHLDKHHPATVTLDH